ncbi:MAG: SdrD B-like domain-containing protein [Anaerolineales bacterium]|jgi:hypothetical protein
MNKALLSGFIITAAVLVGCSQQDAEQPEQNRSATETAVALDGLAASTIEALEDLDRTATSAAQTAEPTATQPPPTATMTITTTPTLEFVEVEVSVDTNCRSGPNIAFNFVGALLVGERTQVVARSNAPNYYIVNNPDRPGSTCWLWDRYATIYGDPLRLPMLEAPPTPTPSPATVGGWVFEDVNNNGKWDSSGSDDGIGGVRLVLLVGTCPGGTVGYSAQTDSSGRYLFPRVLAASYCLTTDPPSSSLNPGQYSLNLGSGETRDGMNFWR